MIFLPSLPDVKEYIREHRSSGQGLEVQGPRPLRRSPDLHPWQHIAVWLKNCRFCSRSQGFPCEASYTTVFPWSPSVGAKRKNLNPKALGVGFGVSCSCSCSCTCAYTWLGVCVCTCKCWCECNGRYRCKSTCMCV